MSAVWSMWSTGSLASTFWNPASDRRASSGCAQQWWRRIPHGPGEARPLREAATTRLTNLRVCRVEAAPVLKFVQDALAKRLSIKTSMSSKLRIFPARRREAFGQVCARADGDAEDEIQR